MWHSNAPALLVGAFLYNDLALIVFLTSMKEGAVVADLHLENLPRTLSFEYTDTEARLSYIDQRLLPYDMAITQTAQWEEVVDAIKTLAVRGAPAIGVAGAAAVALWLQNDAKHLNEETFDVSFTNVTQAIANARPTAVNLAWAVKFVVEYVQEQKHNGVLLSQIAQGVCAQVQRMIEDDECTNRLIGKNGSALIPEHARILTHCNAGSLATAFYGTALGVVYAAAEQGKIESVYADETRPVGQGARLTVWELSRAGINVTLNCDNMAATLMAQGKVNCVIVGADRIAKNGDTANKIGTYGLAVLAHYHHIPFYVAAPLSTFDFPLPSGSSIPIEHRSAKEVLSQPIPGVSVYNPAFDVTPGSLITAFITEKGVYQANDIASLE